MGQGKINCLERGYDKKLALGAINAGGGWGILIPPSILMVLYSLLTEVSVGGLFAAGIGPGLTLFVLVSIYIGVRCWLQPELGPALPKEERAGWGPFSVDSRSRPRPPQLGSLAHWSRP